MNNVWNMVKQKIMAKIVKHLKDGPDTLTSEQNISNKSCQSLY